MHVPQTISHANIRRSDLELALENARLDPDGQRYPWRDMYPMTGSTVYADGQLWTVDRTEGSTDGAIVHLSREPSGVDDRRELITLRYALRPVTWTQQQENAARSRDAMKRAGRSLCWPGH